MRSIRVFAMVSAMVLVFGATRLAAEEAAPDTETAPGDPTKQIRFQREWIPPEALYERYLALEGQMKDILEEGRDYQGELDLVNREIMLITAEAGEKERPLRAEMNKATAGLREANRALRARPPAEPRMLPEPRRPTRRSDSDEYDDARDRYEREKRDVERENKRRREQYQKDLAEYKKKQAEAKAQVAEAEKTIEGLKNQLDIITAETEARKAPHIEKRKGISDQIASLKRRAELLIAQTTEIREAFRKAPEELIWRQGLILWDGKLWRIEDLQAHYDETIAAIERVHGELKASAKKAGRNFPEDWRHPQQEEVDRLGHLLDKAARTDASAS